MQAKKLALWLLLAGMKNKRQESWQ